MAYFEAMEEALDHDMIEGRRTVPKVIRDALFNMPDKVAQAISDNAEIADKTRYSKAGKKIDEKLAIEVGELVIREIWQSLEENHPTAWEDEGDLSEYEEKLRLDRQERTREMQDERERMGSYAAMSQEKW